LTEPAVLTEARDQRLYIIMNRPGALNAQNEEMRTQLVEAVERLESTDDLRVGIVSGVGGRAFSAGADLKEVAGSEGGRGEVTEFGRRVPQAEHRRGTWRHFEAFRWASKPLIAAIDGHCVGGGLELANYCDIRIATEASRFGQPEPRTTGGAAGPALHQLPRAMPLGEALLVGLTSQPMTAQRAYEVGLIQRLVPDVGALIPEADAIADQMLECNGDALALVKRVIRWGADMTSQHAEMLHLLADEVQHRTIASLDEQQG
jgi:enoyl-CoA hydratase/carnithine racemase